MSRRWPASRRKPTLDQYDMANRDDYETMQSGTWNKGRGVVRTKNVPYLPVLGGKSPECWCGELNGHDWPGKDDGQAHPR
jgi:hypothetical protein